MTTQRVWGGADPCRPPLKATAWAGGSGFAKWWARPKPYTGRDFGLARPGSMGAGFGWPTAQSRAMHITSYKTLVAPNSASSVPKILENPFVSSSESDESEVDAPWMTVERNHRKSKRAAKKVLENLQPPKADLVREAEKLLTTEEKQRILERRNTEMNADSREEGPSNPKGKEVDPRNWGNANLDESKINLEAQREALSNWAQTHEWSKRAPEPEDGENLVDPITAAVKATKSQMMKLFEGEIQ
ncbi:uncharacterized protein EDB91DRAFT_1279688 [Suillus paluster]|uniref:uncharacterized protein n=1 Tax=Suillus paluster TaxID=48578 RepID=UPI001B86A0AD|nr:uncharacterized protein EDB91DRAFT_1279688 [Suillus paluster]KAG1721047.1 hypothetical protein EDB91DRAFT_1279688 [Suillus paluster]